MGNLCLIVNHSKRIYMHPVMKFRELILNHYGDYLILLQQRKESLLSDSFYHWSGDDVEIVDEGDMRKYETILNNYKDMTKEIVDMFDDQIGKNA